VPSGSPLVAELRGEPDLVATVGDRLADESVVGAGAVQVVGVEGASSKCHAFY
jgi:hypothetical protein